MLDHSWYKKQGIEDIFEKIEAGKRISIEDGERLFACPDIVAVGALAHSVRTRLHGRRSYYVMNQHINYSNICVNGCRFCAFGREKGDPLAFQLTLADIVEKVQTGPNASAITEVHIVGGCHPELPLAYFLDIVGKIKTIRPDVLIKAFTAVEIAHFAQLESCSTKEVLCQLQAAGLDMLPGGGAEVFSPRIRALLCPEKLSGDQWLSIMREAHELGIKSNATLLYGHVETHQERLSHMQALRELQDQTNGFVCFIPLPFQPSNTRVNKVHPNTGVDDLKTMAVSRLMLDNIPHLKAYWVMLTVKLAQIALHFGADDFDGTVIEEKIGHMAGAESEQALSRSELERIIRDAGFEPVERNCFFEQVANY